jgi:enoyl-[acyl-carrier protein] reductase I
MHHARVASMEVLVSYTFITGGLKTFNPFKQTLYSNAAELTSREMSLQGKKGLIVGIANDQSIAWGIAKACRTQGAELAVTFLNEKAERFVRPLAEQVQAELILPLDLQKDGELETVFKVVEEKWGKLDFVLHAVAFAAAADLHGRVIDCSRDGFKLAMDISAFSLVRMAHLAEPLMSQGGSIVTLTYYGSQKVAKNYGIMGSCKAALEALTRSLAVDLGAKKITVNAISAGAIKTRAASGIAGLATCNKCTSTRSPCLSSQIKMTLVLWLPSCFQQEEKPSLHKHYMLTRDSVAWLRLHTIHDLLCISTKELNVLFSKLSENRIGAF